MKSPSARRRGRRPTIIDVAREARVGALSVSRVINNHPSVKTFNPRPCHEGDRENWLLERCGADAKGLDGTDHRARRPGSHDSSIVLRFATISRARSWFIFSNTGCDANRATTLPGISYCTSSVTCAFDPLGSIL
jgi:hypothetical protein